MILVCVFVGLLVGSFLNWASDYLPRFASGGTDTSSPSTSRPRSALWHLLTSFISQGLLLTLPQVGTGFQRKSTSQRLCKPASTANCNLREGSLSSYSQGNLTHLQKSSWLDIAVELFTALLFAYLWMRCGLSLRLLSLALVCSFFLLIAIIDLKYRLVLDVLIYPAAAVALLFHSVPPGRDTLIALLGGAVGLAPFLLVALLKPGGIGGGDVKLAALIGLVVSFPQVLWALTLGILAGGITALVLLIARRWEHGSYIPYAPFLCLGAMFSLVYDFLPSILPL